MDTRAYNLRLGDAVAVSKKKTGFVRRLEIGDKVVGVDLDIEGEKHLVGYSWEWNDPVTIREADRRMPPWDK